MDVGINPKIIVHLRREAQFSDGRSEAFLYAVNCNGDIVKIHTEIQEVEQRIVTGLQENPDGSMSIGSSPRSFQDGYLSGLRDTLQIIADYQKNA